MRGSRWGGDQSDRPRRGRWSQAEVARLKELYGLKDNEAIAKELNRPTASVRKMAETLFPVADRVGPWTAPDIQRLKRYLGIAEQDIIARVLGRSIADVDRQISALSEVQLEKEWSQDEVTELKRLYGTRTDKDIGIIFGRPESSVSDKAKDLCLAKDKAFVRKLKGERAHTRMPRWTAEEIEQLRVLYSDHSNLEIAQKLNRSVKSVVSKAHNIGLRKDPDRLKEMGRQNVSLRYSRQESGKATLEDVSTPEQIEQREEGAGGPPPSDSGEAGAE